MTDKPQIHVSMLDQLAKCGIQFQRRYGARFGVWHEEEIVPPSIALATGISVHRAVEKNLKYKVDQGSLMECSEVIAIAYDEFHKIWDGGMLLTEDESISMKKTLGVASDMVVKLSSLYYIEFAPNTNPVTVEEKFVILLDDFPFDIAGKKDIVEEDKIGDVKTMASNKASVKSMQMATYAMDFKVKHGRYPGSVYHQKLIKTKTPKAVIEEATPDDTWVDPLLRRIERFAEIIDAVRSGKQAFMPADPNHWCCTAKYCGWHRDCPYWSGN